MHKLALFLDRLADALLNTTIFDIESAFAFDETKHVKVGKLTLGEYGLSKLLEELAEESENLEEEIAGLELTIGATSDGTRSVAINRLTELQYFYEQVEALLHISILERHNDPDFPQPTLEVLSDGTVIRIREEDDVGDIRLMH